MCQGSIHVRHREATAKERLVVQSIPNHGGVKGMYSTATAVPLLVCLRGKKEIVIKQVRLIEDRFGSITLSKWQGKRNVKAVFHAVPHADRIILPNGTLIPLYHIADGMRIDVGIPVRVRKPKAKGMVVVEEAIRQAIAMPPEPKPGEGEQPAEPAEGEKPAPAPREPEANRKRRRVKA